MNDRQRLIGKGKNSIRQHQLQLNIKKQEETKRVLRKHTSKFHHQVEKRNSKSCSRVIKQKQTFRTQKEKTKRKLQALDNQKVISSSAYQALYSRYLRIKSEHLSQQTKAKQEISKIAEGIREEKRRLLNVLLLRDRLMQDINRMSQQYNQLRISNYNVHCQIYANQGQIESHYYQSQPELGYEEMLRLQQRIGVVEIGYPSAKIALLPAQIWSGIDQKDCCICCCEIGEGQAIAKTKCQHVLHHQCLQRWLQFKKTCPLCRQQIVIS